MIQHLSTATPFEVDSELARLDGEYYKLDAERMAIFESAHNLIGERKNYRTSRKGVWPTSDIEALTELAQRVATQGIDALYFDKACDQLARFAIVQKKIRANRQEARWLDDEYSRRPWSRFFLVISSDGHIHRNTSCSSFPRTQHGWQPELSGKTEKETVAKLGPLLCTKCFPSAPLDWTKGVEKAADPSRCVGTGQPAENTDFRWAIPRGNCPECGKPVTPSRLGKTPRHKPAEKKGE